MRHDSNDKNHPKNLYIFKSPASRVHVFLPFPVLYGADDGLIATLDGGRQPVQLCLMAGARGLESFLP